MTRTLFTKALENYNLAVNTYNTMGNDEVYLNYVGYNLQQALELCIKYLLEENGVEYKKTHNIDQLIRSAEENGVDLYLTDYIKEHSEMFTEWEGNARYIVDYQVAKSKIEHAIENMGSYLEEVKNHRIS